MKKRLLSWILVMAMVASLIPSTMVSALAAVLPAEQAAAAGSGVTLPVTYTQEYNVGSESSDIEITEAGTYKLTGNAVGISVIVSTSENVTLVLNGLKLSNEKSPLQLGSGANVTLVLLKGTKNRLTCTAEAANNENNGMTAGIYVPEDASLTVDRSSVDSAAGSLTVQGGYGGAGIGGSAGFGLTETRAPSGGASYPGQDSYVNTNMVFGPGLFDWEQASAQGATYVGGDGWLPNGGFHGKQGGSAGTITINSGILNIQGGAGGAGIGGGRGANGGDGSKGYEGYVGLDGGYVIERAAKETKTADGNTMRRSLHLMTSSGGSSGGSAGGTGGSGGNGGAGGSVSINGGTVTAIGGTGASDIGGGLAGIGGAGGIGGKGGDGRIPFRNLKLAVLNYYSPWDYVGQLTYYPGTGGAGGDGQNGYTGASGNGGDGGSLTITGGSVTLGNQSFGSTKAPERDKTNDPTIQNQGKEGSYGVAADEVSKWPPRGNNDAGWNGNTLQGYLTGVDAQWENKVYVKRATDWGIYVAQGGKGGAGGLATKPTEATDGKTGSLTITDAASTATNWSDYLQDGNLTLETRPKDTAGNELYLYRLTVQNDKNENLYGATVTVRNVQGTLGQKYTWTTTTNADGIAFLWLPLGSYTLDGKDVYQAGTGYLSPDEPYTVEVKEDDSQGGTAIISQQISLTATASKMYISSDAEQPVTVTINADALESDIKKVEWFAAPISDSTVYSSETTGTTTAFDEGYAKADTYKAEIAVDGKKEWTFTTGQNARYWVQVTTYESNMTLKLVGEVDVTNIYRKFSIQVNSYYFDNGSKVDETQYQPLKRANGLEYTGDYGFAWDLNGYSEAMDSTKLLSTDVAPADTVTIAPADTAISWYSAALETGEKLTEKTSNGNTAKPLTLTLNDSFLANNSYCDSTADGKKDPSKYTIVYTALDNQLDVITITGTVEGAPANTAPLYSHARSYTTAIDSDTIEALSWPEYKLVGVKVNGAAKDLDQDESGATLSKITVENIHGKNGGTKIKTVEFIYLYNMTNVTVNAVLNDAKKDSDTPNKVSATQTEKLELGTEHTFVPPVVPGYECVGSNKGNDYKISSVAANDSITFYYEKSEGNVTYQAVNEDGDVLWHTVGSVTKGNTPEAKTPDKGVDNYEVNPDVATKYTITGTDTVYPKADGRYDGINNITVTYTYKHKTRNVVAELYDLAKRDKPLATTDPVPYNVGDYPTINAPQLPSGYSYFGANSKVVKITEGQDTIVVTFYCKASEAAAITVRMYDSEVSRDTDTDGSKAFQTVTISAAYGVASDIQAPTMTGWELDTNATDNDATKTVVPSKDGEAVVVKFVYKAVYDTVTVKYKVKDLNVDFSPEDTYQVQQGQDFTVTAPYKKDYKLAKDEMGTKTLTAAQIANRQNEITFYYSKLSAEDLVKIAVKGVDANGSQLYSYEKLVPVGAADQQIAAFNQPKQVLESATVDGQTAEISAAKEVTVSLDGKNANDEIAVVFTYKSNVTTVTINAKLNSDKATAVPGFQTIEVNAEIGDTLTYTAPAIENYVYVGRTHESGLKVTGDTSKDVIDFYYEAAPVMGNVTYVAVDKDHPDTILAYGKGAKLTKDQIVDVDTASGITKFFPAGVTNWEWTKEAPSVTGAVEGKYDGKTDVTVTFTFTRGSKSIGIKLMDADTGEEIKVENKTFNQIVSKGVETEISAPSVDGYTAIPNQAVKITAADNDVAETVTFFYRKNDNSASVTVELWYKDPETNTEKLFNSYTIPGVLGTSRTVTAPDLSGQGFSNPDKTKADVTFEANTPAVKFVYQTVAHKTITVELKSGADDLTTQVTNLKTRYVLRMGETLTVNAPSIYGYALAEKQPQVISKTYDQLADNEVIIINYKKVEVDFVKITVIGKVENAATNLYSYETSVAVDAGSAELNVYDWPQYKVKDGKAALTGGAAGDTELTVANDKVTVNFNDADRSLTVTVAYVKNTAPVTVKAHLFVNNAQTTEPVEGFTEITFEAVIGEDTTYTAPSLPGYAYKGSSMTDNKITVTGNGDTIIFYYAKSAGQVTYKAVDAAGQDLGYSYSETLAEDEVVSSGTDKAPKVPNYRVKADGQVKVEGATVDNKFDGKNPVTVTYTYEKFTKKIKIILMDDATHKEIATTESATYEAGANVDIPAPDITKIAAMNGYTLVSAETQKRFIMDNEIEQTVTFYYSMEQAQRPKITVNLKDEKGNLIHAYTVTGDWDLPMTIEVPDLTGQGYVYSENGVATVTVKPEQNDKGTLVKDLTYNTQYWKITVDIQPPEAAGLLPESSYARTYQVRRNSSFTLTAPSIAGYTLTSGKLNKVWDKVTADESVIFTYQAADQVTNSVHTIIGKTNDGTQLYKFTQTVIKDGGETIYNATPIDGYTVDKETQTVSNAENKTIEFVYTDNAATVTVIPVDENGAEIPGASVTYTGYKKGQQGVKVRAPHVDGKVLLGPWVGDKQNGTDLIQTIDLSATAKDNVVKFAYKSTPQNVITFVLHCADDPGTVIRVIEGSVGEWSVASNGKLDLTVDGFVFDAANTGNSDEFKNGNTSVTIASDTSSKTYNLYYKHIKQELEYKYMNGNEEIPSDTVTNPNPSEWSVNENLVVVAPQIPGYTANQLRQSVTITKQADGTKQTITFQYTKKATGTITVEHKLEGAATAFSSYTVYVSDGEWFTANALNDAKYTLKGNATQTVQASSADPKTITFEYQKNFVTVNTYTNLGTSNEPYESNIEVTKGESVELTPPARSRFVLKGIKVVIGENTYGGEDTLNVNGYYANDKLTLSNLGEDAKVYYYYKSISDAVTENQVEITVVEKYKVWTLGTKTYKETKLEADTLSAPYTYSTYAGFKLIDYEIDGVAQQLVENFTGASVNHKQNHTITYIYDLEKDGNEVVVPGADGKLPSGDDVTIKPNDPAEKPTVDDKDKTVTVPDGGGTVTTPDGTVDVPGGSKVDEKGNITTPDGDTIKPGEPAETKDYYFVQYKANGGVGDSHTEYYKKDGGSATLKDVGELFTYNGYTASGWNTYANGKGDAYTAKTEVTGKSLTLYAQWTKSAEPTGQYKATIVLKPNGAEAGDVTQTIASNDNNPIRENIQANPFSIEGWTFKGWLTAKTDDSDATYYADQAVAEVANGDTLTLYAQWIKVGADGSITVPGKDNKPGTEDDVTAKPGENGKLDRDDSTGEITIPSGGSAVKGNEEIDMPNGGTVKPDGTIIIKDPDGDITIKPDGSTETDDPNKTVYTLTYKSGVKDVKDVKVYFTNKTTVQADVMTREGYKVGQWLDAYKNVVAVGSEITDTTELTASWYKINSDPSNPAIDGSITVPGPNGTLGDDDDVTIRPNDKGEKPTWKDDGSGVNVPNGGGVETKPGGPVIVPPNGSWVKPDGTIVLPDGKTIDPTKPDAPIDGYFKVTYQPGDSDVTGQKNLEQLVKIGDKAIVMGNPFASAQKVFIGWKDGVGNVVELTAELDGETTLIAQWKTQGSVTLEWAKDSKVQNGVKDGEYKLVMRGEWATTDSDKTDKNYTIPVLVDGKAATSGALRWYVDAASYKTEFGFTNSSLTGDDIVTVNATTGEITVKNSGIVRVWCESTADPTAKKSVVIIVAGDITKDGRVAMSDINYLYALVDEDTTITAVDETDPSTWYLQDLADLSANNQIDMGDINALWPLVDEDSFI